MQVAYSVLASMEKFRKSHSVVLLIYRVFCSELDEATWRYTMHWRQLLTELPLASSRDFGVFIRVSFAFASLCGDSLTQVTFGFLYANILWMSLVVTFL